MRRLLWIVPSIFAVALTGYIIARPSAAPADPTDSAPATVREASPPITTELPITQVVLYSSGVGYFQRDGQVDGNTRVELNFPVADVNDLLKSMVLQDLGGGKVSAVGYDSHDPLDKTLNSFAIHLTGNPSHAQILNQARGEKVELTLAAKPYGPVDSHGISQGILLAVHGTVMGVETKPGTGKDAGPVEMLTLWSPDGMRSIPVAEIQRVKFMNPAVESEVDRALEVLARGHDTQKKAVSLQFDGTGKRAVRVGYVVETPLWRTSYRLLVGKDGKLFVQGWAMVVNPTNEDWKDVRMALVSGRPISFKMDLYQPLYVPRPVVQPELYASIRPTAHAQTLTSGNFAQFGITPATAPASAMSPGSQQPVTNIGFPFNQNGQLNNNASVTPRGIKDVDGSVGITLQNGIASAASATDLGDTFQYAIDNRVTIPRQKSAMLPIVNQALDGDKVSVYNSTAHAKYPLLALRLKNTTGLHLMQGPVAVFEGTGYSGDTQMPDLQPGEDRLVSYALDLGTEVQTVSGDSARQVLSIRLKKGIVTLPTKLRESKTYSVKNRSPHDRVVLVEHSIKPGYKLVSETEPKELARDAYRFEVDAGAGKTFQLKVVEEKILDQGAALALLSADQIREYLQFEFSDPEVKVALQKVLEMQNNVQKAQQEKASLEQKLKDITQDQARLRANLKEMPETAAAYKRYLEKFDNQETQTRVQQLRDDCTAYLEGLDLEATIKIATPFPAVGGPVGYFLNSQPQEIAPTTPFSLKSDK
jgi:hypothetical protein